jgi:hypothetical protein
VRAALLGLVSCTAAAPAPGPIHNAPAVVAPATLVVSLERTECLGHCPTYTVELWSDGGVVWNGHADVAQLGVAHGQISTSSVAAVVTAFERAGFFAIDRKSPRFVVECFGAGAKHRCVTVICTAMDQPTAIVTVVRAGQAHTAELVPCGSHDDLPRAEQLVDDLAHTEAWIGPH